MLPALLDAALEEPYLRGLQVYLTNTGQVYRSGATMLTPLDATEVDMGQAQMRPTPKSIRFAHPIVANDQDQPLGWVELELRNAPFLVRPVRMVVILQIYTL